MKNKLKRRIRPIDYHLEYCIEARFWKVMSSGSNHRTEAANFAPTDGHAGLVLMHRLLKTERLRISVILQLRYRMTLIRNQVSRIWDQICAFSGCRKQNVQ